MTYVGIPAAVGEAVQAAAVAVLTDRIGAATSAGRLDVYTGSAPTTAGGATLETLLLSFTFADPAFGAESGGVVDLDVSTPITADGLDTGTAGWGRLVDGDGNVVIDGDVADADATFVLSTVAVVTGATVTLTSGSLATVVASTTA